MRDVCPKCLHRVKPEHMAGTGQGYAQLWRCPECGGEEKMCRWLFKLPEEKITPTPEQNRRKREKKREWERANRYRINSRRRKRYAEDPEYRKKASDARKRYYWSHREEVLAKNAKYQKENAEYIRYMRKRRKLMRYREQKANEQKED